MAPDEDVPSRKPIGRMGLGELVMEMQKIAFANSYVFTAGENEIEKVPDEPLKNSFRRYHELKKELNEREKAYLHREYIPPPRYK